MPARTDHDRRDAQHAARATVAVELGRYSRRLIELAYAAIEEEATRDHKDSFDWSEFGATAAARAIKKLGDENRAVAAGKQLPASSAGADSTDDAPNA